MAYTLGSQTPFPELDGSVCLTALRPGIHLLFPFLVFDHGTGKLMYRGTVAMLLVITNAFSP